MNISIRLLLEEFLGLMREEGELDAFMPLLLSAMGHEIVYRAQKGPRQYGVDILTVGRDTEGGRTKLFLWLVKRGHLGRDAWDTTKQSLRQSIDDVGDTYLDTHIAPQHAALPRKLVILTNGDFAAALSLTLATYLKKWSQREGVETALVNGSTLAGWTERFLLDEHLLPQDSRTLLRRMLVNVGAPELSLSFGRELISQYVQSASGSAPTKGQSLKRLLVGLRGVRTALAVLYQWGANEENLLAPYRLTEYALLAVWSQFHERIVAGDKDVQREFAALLEHWCSVALAYHRRLEPYYYVQDSLALPRRDALLVGDTVFSELGRLGLQVVYWGAVAMVDPAAVAAVNHYSKMLRALLRTHGSSGSPPYDRHSADVHVALLALLVINERKEAEAWVERMAIRLMHAAQWREYWPLVASFEDALSVRAGEAEHPEEFMPTTTLVPVLLTWAAAFGRADLYAFLRDKVMHQLPGTTPNLWDSDAGFDSLLADPRKLFEHGVAMSVSPLPAQAADFLQHAAKPLGSVASIEDASWYQARLAFVPLLAAQYWGLQIPREMLVKHAAALVSAVSGP